MNDFGIRTGTCSFFLPLSESTFHSDRNLLFFSSLVRIILLFGQEPALSSFSCSNHPCIRTGTCSFFLPLSESTFHSDRVLLFFSSLVRINLLFGQEPALSSFPCPNHPCIRTGTCSFSLSLSESPFYSDRNLLFLRSLVRIILAFGQEPALFLFPCPNHPSIRTGTCFFFVPLSESSFDSDRVLLFFSSLVRINLAFGQGPALFLFPCPNQPSIRTKSNNSVFRRESLLTPFITNPLHTLKVSALPEKSLKQFFYE
ncbi:hypothetical protein [Neobacillus cucumis]|uniref:hypothetical protein n=1 Tax=Neobacillus cucumis TaxID=1740721 RepID=UPI001963DFFE|nr:hypothetical protein [Neobacillus cucumis]MBM7651070.1 hypothetical protein [Neobacillus cucumis]